MNLKRSQVAILFLKDKLSNKVKVDYVDSIKSQMGHQKENRGSRTCWILELET